MLRKLMLLVAVAALAACTAPPGLDICADVGYWDGDGIYVTEPSTNPACQGLVEEPLPEVPSAGSN